MKGAKYMKNEVGHIQIDGAEIMQAEIMQRWRRYFSILLNEENQYELEQPKVEGPIDGVKTSEVKEVLQKMNSGKAPGPSGVTSGVMGRRWPRS